MAIVVVIPGNSVIPWYISLLTLYIWIYSTKIWLSNSEFAIGKNVGRCSGKIIAVFVYNRLHINSEVHWDTRVVPFTYIDQPNQHHQ